MTVRHSLREAGVPGRKIFENAVVVLQCEPAMGPNTVADICQRQMVSLKKALSSQCGIQNGERIARPVAQSGQADGGLFPAGFADQCDIKRRQAWRERAQLPIHPAFAEGTISWSRGVERSCAVSIRQITANRIGFPQDKVTLDQRGNDSIRVQGEVFGGRKATEFPPIVLSGELNA